jgi:hypothetical protein
MRRENWTLLAICDAGESGLSPVQLQKTMFLLGREMSDAVGDGFYDFVPYNYGPFDARVYSDAEYLASKGLVDVGQPMGARWKTFRATAKGCAAAAEVESSIDPKAVDYLRDVVAWTQKLSFQALVKAIYTKYPEMRANSVFAG